MKSLAICCPSTGGHEGAQTTWADTMSRPHPILINDMREGEKAGFLTKCETFRYETDAEVIGYLHSDLYTHEHGWDKRVLDQFEDERVAVVGVVGATGLAHEDLYKLPFHFTQLARYGVIGNLTDMEVHGERFTGSKDVAVVDSCAVFVRTAFINAIGGWPCTTYPNSSHCSDLWLCCMCHRLARTVRMVGISCTHRSGGKGEAGSRWLEQHGGDSNHHQQAHRLIYEDFRDVLPIRIA